MRLADTAQRAIVGGWRDGEKVREKEREKVPLWNVCGREIERELIEIKSVCDNIEGERVIKSPMSRRAPSERKEFSLISSSLDSF